MIQTKINKVNWKQSGIVILILLALVHLFIVCLNHYYFRTFAYYYGVYNFAFFDFAHLKNSAIPLLFDESNATFLQDHFSFLLILATPFYWLLNGLTATYTLLLIQWVCIVYGAWATFQLIKYKSQSFGMAFAATICYFILYSRFSSYQSDCNLAIIGSALIPVFLYYFTIKKFKSLLIVFVVLLITREDFSLWLIFICLFLMIDNQKDKKQFKLSLVLMLVSAVFFIIIFKWIIPALESETAKFVLFNYSALGQTPLKALQFILQHPFESFKLLFINHLQNPDYDWYKFKYYLVFGLSGGILFLFRPLYLICLIPIITKKMYNDDSLRWTYETYYGIETASILPALVFLLIADLKTELTRKMLSILVLTFTLATSYYCFSVSNYPFAFSKFQFFRSSFYYEDYHSKLVHQALAQIPENASVSASSRLLPHLANRKNIYYFTEVHDADFVCISLDGDAWPYSKEDYNQTISKMMKTGLWELKYAVGNIVVFKKKTASNN